MIQLPISAKDTQFCETVNEVRMSHVYVREVLKYEV